MVLAPSEKMNRLLVSRETSPIQSGARMVDLLKRPQIGYADLAPFDPERDVYKRQVCCAIVERYFSLRKFAGSKQLVDGHRKMLVSKKFFSFDGYPKKGGIS